VRERLGANSLHRDHLRGAADARVGRRSYAGTVAPAGAVLSGRGALVAVTTVAGFAVMVVGYSTTGALASVAGIEQRAVIAVAWVWLTWLALFASGRLRLERPS
jgi:hypothetical protein